MIQRLIIFIAVLIQPLVFFASNPNADMLKKANEQYEKGNYRVAIDNYQIIIQNKFESAPLYYNLGNAYFKISDFTQAIYYFEKAKRLNPGDEDIKFNIALANTKILDKIEVLPDVFFVRWWNGFTHLFSTNLWAVWILVLFMLFLSATGFYLYSQTYTIKKFSFYTAIGFLSLFLLSWGAASSQYNQRMKENEAIVFTPTVNIKASPDENSNTIFVIHEGSKLQITDKIGNWYEIRILNGSKGWIKADDLKII